MGNIVFLVSLFLVMFKANAHDHGSVIVDETDNSVFQQTISGTVTDGTGTPLPGASIVEQGTSNGIQTDFDGNFTLKVSDLEVVLVISLLGSVR